MNKFLLLLTLIVFLPMNVYSRALKYVDMKDVKQKHQRKLVEKKIIEQKKNKFMEQLKYKNSPLYSNWRYEISEGMTTSDVFSTTLPATGETTLSTYEYDVTFGPNSNDPDTFAAAGGLIYDTRYYDTVVFDLSPGTGPLVIGFFTVGSDQGTFYSVPSSAGTYAITIPDGYRIPSVAISWISSGSEGQTTGYGNWRVSDIRFQRRSPMNVFVPLDSPEATSFIRTGSGDLSPEEKQKKLKEMLEASDEYVQKMYGDEFPGSGAVPPGESGITPGVQTIDYGNDLTPLSSNPYGTEVGQVAGTYDLIKSGQVPYMKPDKAKQILSDPKYQQLWDDDPDALKAVQKLVKGV